MASLPPINQPLFPKGFTATTPMPSSIPPQPRPPPYVSFSSDTFKICLI